jgi:hypothetical protein
MPEGMQIDVVLTHHLNIKTSLNNLAAVTSLTIGLEVGE